MRQPRMFAPSSVSSPYSTQKTKKTQLLPDYVLRAERVLVVIHPDAGESLTSPMANRTAQDDVEKAITKRGRFNMGDGCANRRFGHCGSKGAQERSSHQPLSHG